ncbi:MAG: prolipoprotein diacylglyceryl transferase [Firmicutes bacterium HGW-Firmicutes-9]|jgi:phosphatidylglycerol:prolipoprotein diacylglycerol transferase|nr:MAG: prolipoprotein diacylglyceryl transferase [Firmicutes bacterium HGW-Firmicutes-9]
MLPSFQAFGLTIPMYGVMSAVGMLAAFVLLGFTRKHTRFSEDQALSAAIWAILAGFIGAKVLYWLVEIDQIIADPSYLIHTLREGFVFYGALIGGLAGVAIYSLIRKLPFFSLTDYFIPALVIGHAFGRIGCVFAGCCYGMECESPISIVFPAGSAAPAGIPLLPTQIMESVFLFLLCAFLVWRLAKQKPFGTVSGWYMVLYGAWRFGIEFFRNDDRGAVGVLSTSQFISIFVLLGGVALLLLVKFGVLKKTVLDLPIPVEEEPKKKKKDKVEASEEPVKAEEEAKPEEISEEKPEAKPEEKE